MWSRVTLVSWTGAMAREGYRVRLDGLSLADIKPVETKVYYVFPRHSS